MVNLFRLYRIPILLLLPLSAAALPGCGEKPTAAAATPVGMVRIPGGTFRMGAEDSPFRHESPVHRVKVDSFYLDAREVTNRQFREFVSATGYRTVAEREGWSGVFDTKTGQWAVAQGASWLHPSGPGSGIKGREEHPAVHIAFYDAQEYCRWAGKRLPTEAEWEFAARGGLEGRKFPWGDEREPGGKLMANYWQGSFPEKDAGRDGFRGTAPAGSFPANGYGLYDMAGNVWEWVEDRFSPTYYAEGPAENPRGPAEGEERVIRGGSFLCAQNFCTGYRVAARNKTAPDSGNNHQGFRCAKDAR